MNQIWNGKKHKLPVWILAAAACMLVLSGCKRGDAADEARPDAGEKKLQVVTTLFPYYDFTRQAAGDQVDLSIVIPAGMDSHSFEPTPADIRMIQNADLLICNGGAMEQWVSRVLSSLDTSGMTVITMMDYVDTVEEEVVEGMEDGGHDHHAHEDVDHVHGDVDHAHEDVDHAHGDVDHAHGDGIHSHEGWEEFPEDESRYEIEYDEHIWTAPANAMKIVKVISDTLQELDGKNKDVYAANTKEYLKKLEDLDQQFWQVIAEEKRDIIIMGDKFPLRYFADEYGLRYRAAFSGCSNDTEPSAKTIAYLIDKVKEEHIPVVYYLELSSPRVAEIIGEETGAEPLLFHSCHNVTRREFENGVTYLDLMEKNVENLRKGLCE